MSTHSLPASLLLAFVASPLTGQTFQDLFDRADAMQDSPAEALAVVEQAIQRDPRRFEGHRLRAGLLLRLGRAAEASEAAQRARELLFEHSRDLEALMRDIDAAKAEAVTAAAAPANTGGSEDAAKARAALTAFAKDPKATAAGKQGVEWLLKMELFAEARVQLRVLVQSADKAIAQWSAARLSDIAAKQFGQFQRQPATTTAPPPHVVVAEALADEEALRPSHPERADAIVDAALASGLPEATAKAVQLVAQQFRKLLQEAIATAGNKTTQIQQWPSMRQQLNRLRPNDPDLFASLLVETQRSGLEELAARAVEVMTAWLREREQAALTATRQQDLERARRALRSNQAARDQLRRNDPDLARTLQNEAIANGIPEFVSDAVQGWLDWANQSVADARAATAKQDSAHAHAHWRSALADCRQLQARRPADIRRLLIDAAESGLPEIEGEAVGMLAEQAEHAVAEGDAALLRGDGARATLQFELAFELALLLQVRLSQPESAGSICRALGQSRNPEVARRADDLLRTWADELTRLAEAAAAREQFAAAGRFAEAAFDNDPGRVVIADAAFRWYVKVGLTARAAAVLRKLGNTTDPAVARKALAAYGDLAAKAGTELQATRQQVQRAIDDRAPKRALALLQPPLEVLGDQRVPQIRARIDRGDLDGAIDLLKLVLEAPPSEAFEPRSPTTSKPEISKDFLTGFGTRMIWIEPGTVRPRPVGADARKELTIEEGFWIAETRVRVADWLFVLGGKADKCALWPHVLPEATASTRANISWSNAALFCAVLTENERRNDRLPADYEYALPTEAQWEYACRAGTETDWWFGGTLDTASLNKPNPWGVCELFTRANERSAWDLEWCQDEYRTGETTRWWTSKRQDRDITRALRGGSAVRRDGKEAFRPSPNWLFRIALVRKNRSGGNGS